MMDPERRRGLHRSRRFEVADESMSPALLPGDRLWVDTAWFSREPPRPGDVVVVRDPEEHGRLLLKRVSSVELDARGAPVRVRVLGDLKERSRDSRAFGPVACADLVGLAWYRYAPADRAGPL
jgi:signal peptidase I